MIGSHSASIRAVAVLLISLTLVAAVTEQDMKAVYVLNVLRFAEHKTTVSNESLDLCLISPGPVEKSLRGLENTPVRGKKLRIRTAAHDDLRGCQILFLGGSAGQEGLLAKAQRSGTLTIGHEPDFLSRGGAVSLLIENRRIVVEVNPLVVKDAGWVFSSHLMEIARVSTGDRP